MSEAELARAEAEASDWFTRLKRTTISTEELYGFQAWRRDPAHAAAFARVEAAWKLTERLAGDPDIVAATSKAVRDHPAARPRVSWRGLAPAVGGVGVVAAATLGVAWMMRAGESYATSVGEQRLVALEDGSRVRLNTDSAVRVDYDGDIRRIVLRRGEAYFEVAHDAARPFVVVAGAAEVRALGTRFDVRRDAGGVHVVLVQGRVRVEGDGGATRDLAPNQQLTVTARGLSPVRPADAVAAAGWTTGRLTFRDMALKDAVAEVNRYSARKIVLDAPAEVAAEPVTGVFNVGDTRAFVTAVSVSFALDADWRPGGEVRLSSPAP